MKTKSIFTLGLLAAFGTGLATYHPLAQAVESLGTSSCTSSQPCIGGVNAGKGNGVLGTSAKGTGIIGQTSSAAKAASFGIWGRDASSTGTANAGVFGTSPRGAGVIGQSQRGIGVNGILKGPLSSNPPFSPAAMEASDNTAAGGSGIAFIGVSTNNNAVYGEADSGSNSYSAFLANAPNGADLFYGQGDGSSSQVVIDTGGNFYTNGLVYTGGQCNAGCIEHHRLKEAAVTSAAPTIEDAGEGRIVAGSGFVALDPRFENAIDLRSNYLVFLTPEGDTRGLFVAHRAANGFTVREIEGGRSTIEFAYRIVAHPFAASNDRLPFVDLKAPARPRLPVATTLEP